MAVPSVSLFYSLTDSKGETGTFRIKFPTTVDIAILKEFARSTGTMIDGLVRGRISDVSIGIGVENLPGGWKTTPLAGSDVEEGARFSWRTLLGSKPSFRIPTFDEAFIVDGTKEVDVADTAVDAFVDRVTEGLTQGLINVSPADDRGEDIVALENAVESFNKSRS